MKHKISFIFFILGLSISFALAAGSAGAETIAWLSYDKAKQTRLDRKFLIYFYADWCGYCRSLENTTLKDPEIAAYINRHFIPVRINIDHEKQIAAYHEVGGVPDLQFYTPQWKEIAKRPGYIKAQQLLPLLKYISTNSYQTQKFSEFLKDNS